MYHDAATLQERDGIRLASRPRCLILAAPATGAVEPPCPVGQFIRALNGLHDTATQRLSDFETLSASPSPAAPEVPGAGPMHQ